MVATRELTVVLGRPLRRPFRSSRERKGYYRQSEAALMSGELVDTTNHTSKRMTHFRADGPHNLFGLASHREKTANIKPCLKVADSRVNSTHCDPGIALPLSALVRKSSKLRVCLAGSFQVTSILVKLERL